MLMPLNAIYSAITRARLAAYRRGLLSVSKLPVPVISVGNLTTGGTGKTPLVEWICRKIAEDGRRVCILTRGYGRVNPKSQLVVSNGTQILTDEPAAGDEPFLLAQNLLGLAAVICNPNRVAAGEWAIKNLGTEVFVLDDGFQHLRLERDLNIAVMDATDPWGGGALLPQGRLREPIKGLSRADCIVLTRTDQIANLNSLRDAVQEKAGAVPILSSRMRTTRLQSLSGEVAPLRQPVAAFCGVGNPESFFSYLRRAEYDLVFTRAFADHHRYKQADVDGVAREAQARGAVSLITTAKDATKLRSLRLPIPCYVLEIEILIDEEERLVQLIRGIISAAGG